MFNKSTYYTYCFIRKDLNPTQKIVQLGHVTYELAKRQPQDDSEPCNLILFEIKDEKELVATSYYLEHNGIEHYMFDEPDYDLGFTAIACVPVTGQQREIFSEFRLHRH